MPLIQMVEASRHYDAGTAALKQVNVTVEAGEFVAIVGPSGSGKSTLLNLIGGLDRASSGEVWVEGVNLQAASEQVLDEHRRHRVGFVFQSFHLNPRRTALENVMLPLLFAHQQADGTTTAVERLRWVHMEEYANRAVATLSGGQRQRVAIARALVGSPRILLADEPVGNLDAASGSEVVNLLLQLNREHQLTVLAVSHDVMLLQSASRLLEMADGQLQDVSSTRHLRAIAAPPS